MDTKGTRGGFLTGLSVWALAFGCVIGWGSFVMPGTSFLPDAGPIGTVIGAAIAAAMILVVGLNYAFLARRYRGKGSYFYTKELLGDDHAFLSAWSLALAYLSLLWANATAFILIGRYLVGGVLEWGFHYRLAGYDIYFGEVLATVVLQTLFGLLLYYGKQAATVIRTAAAVIHFVSVVALFCVVVAKFGTANLTAPAFSAGKPRGIQIMNIAIIAPWMYVGFEAVFDAIPETKLPVRRVSAAALTALICGMAVYILLTLIAAAHAPEGYAGWPEYIADLGNKSGVEGMPVLYNLRAALGVWGLRLAGAAIFATLTSSVLGFYTVTARVLSTMASDGLAPKQLAAEVNGVPRNALKVIMLISLPIPLLGRTAVGWNADVSTLSVAIVYTYISLCAWRAAEGRKAPRLLGAAGIACSALVFFFLLVPNLFSEIALATESYFMLAAWSFLGIGYYWLIMFRDRNNRFGKSTIMWVLMLFLLFFSGNVWLRLDSQERLAMYAGLDAGAAEGIMRRNSLVMMALIIISLVIMFSLFTILLRRERELDLKIIQAEERNRAKTAFLSNMSHDIRTPMNAIVGFTELAIRTPEDREKVREYLEKIKASSDHLLGLINDVLEMSRIESGKIELEETEVSLRSVLRDLNTIILGQVEAKNQELVMDAAGIVNEDVCCDRLRLNQVLLNLLSNAVKYTPDGGRISVRLSQTGDAPEGWGDYTLRVKDNGIGMTPEFAARVFEAFEREKTSTVSGIQGTGLGMAITKRIIDLMGGTIDVVTAPGEGTEFIVKLRMRLQENRNPNDPAPVPEESGAAEEAPEQSFGGKRLLLVDDIEVNREIAAMVLQMNDFEVDEACDGAEAVEKVRVSAPGTYDAVLMDIQMPVMNGYEAARSIRELPDPEKAAIPIIAMTANAFEEDKKAALDAGMNGHIAKPIDVDALIATLRRVLVPAEDKIGTGITV